MNFGFSIKFNSSWKKKKKNVPIEKQYEKLFIKKIPLSFDFQKI